ncbi:MAG: tRNA (N6-isopentenyl adenosine(37)-C2)-methylthiotransferase MiaB [Thermodesulfovibrionales bacterium]|nr:tRNA (N6-isopentenyl adenosine(37)-C2)-methylthiotransferase MiaB [Thermodesulfovibrionales bacterium]
MNVHDSEKILGVLDAEGYKATNDPLTAELIILNTCSIRQKAEQKFYSELGRFRALKKKKPGLRIAIAGCIAQQEGMKITRKAPYVDFVFGPQNVHLLTKFLKDNEPHIATEDNPDIALHELPVIRNDRIKAWVTIMYGCNNFCSYCVVPYTRGRERSRPGHAILKEAAGLAESGCREITLLGQNVNSYRSDLDFPGLLREIDKIEGIERIRFVTSHPKDLSDALIDAIAELPMVCEHIHLPLQSGSDAVLQHMNRRYTYKEYREKVEKLRNKVPGIAITSDIIAGFPGETVKDHINTVNALHEIEYDGIFAFNFSPRPDTGAAEMDDSLPQHIKSSRLYEILAVQEKITARKNKSLEGTRQEILVEGKSRAGGKQISGRTRTNKIVTVETSDCTEGTLMNVEIVRARQHSLEGKLPKE